jgi:hypothetical protein
MHQIILMALVNVYQGGREITDRHMQDYVMGYAMGVMLLGLADARNVGLMHIGTRGVFARVAKTGAPIALFTLAVAIPVAVHVFRLANALYV